MTTPFGSATWPFDPTGPSAPPAGYVAPAAPDPTPTEPPETSAQIEARRAQFYELLLREIVKAFTGFFVPDAGTAFDQLAQWVSTIPLLSVLEDAFTTLLQSIIDGFTGVPAESIELGVAFPHRFPTNFSSTTTTTGSLFPLLQQILGLFGGASTLEQVINFFNNLIAQLGWPALNENPETFDPSAALIDWLNILLDPLGLLFSQNQMQSATPDSFWPSSWDFPWPDTVFTDLEQFVENFFRSITGFGSTDFDTVGTGTGLSQNVLLPTGIVAPLDGSTGLLPDGNAPQLLQDVIDAAVNAFQTGVLGLLSGFGIPDFFGAFTGTLGVGTSAQGSANTANGQNIIQDAVLSAQAVVNASGAGSGSSVSSSFDGAASTTLPGFNQRYRQNNGGTSGLDGEGNAVWNEDGSGVSECINRSSIALTTDTQSVFFVLEDGVALGGPGIETSAGALSLIARCNSASNSYVVATIYDETAEIGYVISDVYTRLGAAVSITHGTGQTWEFQVGTLASSRQFKLMQNGHTRVDRTDAGAASLLGASNRFPGFIQLTSQAFFWFYFQGSPGTVKSWSAADRVAA